MAALNTDLYELTMAAGYFLTGKQNDVGTFELMVRRLPEGRNFLIAAGLQQAIEYLTSLRFEKDEIDYLRGLPQFQRAPSAFFDYLARLRFDGDLLAVPEGTPIFPGEPILTVRAPLIQAQLAETYLLSTIAYQTSVASKAARCVFAANGRSVVEFGSRRAHSGGAGPLAGRAAYLAGCAGTSNAESGFRFGIPVFGTAAHSWVMSFSKEAEAQRVLQQLLGDWTVYLIDTYDSIAGAKLAIDLGRPLWGVRLDSGDLAGLSRHVREMLDRAGLTKARIMATNDLDEYRIQELLNAGAPIDSFGVGTALATSADAPALPVVYKLVEIQSAGEVTYTAKFSEDKATLPAAKQLFRHDGYDELDLLHRCRQDEYGTPLLRPYLVQGEPVEAYPSAAEIRAEAIRQVEALPLAMRRLRAAAPRVVRVSKHLQRLCEELRQHNVVAAS